MVCANWHVAYHLEAFHVDASASKKSSIERCDPAPYHVHVQAVGKIWYPHAQMRSLYGVWVRTSKFGSLTNTKGHAESATWTSIRSSQVATCIAPSLEAGCK